MNEDADCETISFRCDNPVVFYKLNTKYVTNRRNTKKIDCTVLYNMLHNYMFRPFLGHQVTLLTRLSVYNVKMA